MTYRRTLQLAAASAGLIALTLLAPHWFLEVPAAHGQEAAKSRAAVKYVFTVDYPVGGKDKYIAWVNSVAKDLTAPAEVRRITSYDDYYGASPHRVVEFEFDSMEDAGKYWANEKVKAVFDDVTEYGLHGTVRILRLRSDYLPK
ncbi:MAG: hypothetical protein OXF11_06300 [Deltaproteobacteria bacterium]|nr:hypothetical protein [Deltaproteobacteria bacterium]